MFNESESPINACVVITVVALRSVQICVDISSVASRKHSQFHIMNCFVNKPSYIQMLIEDTKM